MSLRVAACLRPPQARLFSAFSASADVFSYHLVKNGVFMWPHAGFGHYVTSERFCLRQLRKEQAAAPSSEQRDSWQAIRCRAVLNAEGEVVGVVEGSCVALANTESDKLGIVSAWARWVTKRM